MTKILIVRGKHGDSFYDASTTEDLDAACCEVLKIRFDNNWYYRPKEYENNTMPDDLLNEEQIEQLPTEELRKEFKKKLQSWNKRQKEYETAREWYDKAKTIAEAGKSEIVYFKRRGPLPESYLLLEEHNDYEYEGIELITPIQADLPQS